MQKQPTTREEYLKQINVIVEYINNHLDENIDLKTLADMSCFSPFHFHRIMKAFFGEPLNAFIVRMRVETAAQLIRHTDLPIQEVAYRVGYDMASSLSKVFKRFYSISPTEYRNNKIFIIMKPIQLNEDLNIEAPKIVELESKQVLYVQAFGDYNSIDYCGTWSRLWAFVTENQLFSEGIEHICVYHDDPKVTEADKLRTDICLTLDKKAEPKGEIGVKELKGGKFLVFHFQGSYKHLASVYDMIYAKYIPEGNYRLRDADCFEKYLNNPDNTEEYKLESEIYVPIE